MIFTLSKFFVNILFLIKDILIINCVKIHNETDLIEIHGKIIEGYPVKLESFPFAVIFFNDRHLCSGVILNSYSILTAAHCLDINQDIDQMFIEINTRYIEGPKAEIFEVLSFVVHEHYNKLIPFQADIALVFLKEPIKFGKRKKKALLSSNDDWMEKSKNDVVVIGWGLTKNGGSISNLGLMRTNLQFVSKRKCEKLHDVKLTNDMFCLYGDGVRDTCKGDSGGGVVWNRTVIGIVSHGDGCAKKHKPSIYISVRYHRKWIKRRVEEFFKNYCNLKSGFELR